MERDDLSAQGLGYGLQGIAIVVKPADTGKPGAVSRFMGITGEGEAFPTGDLFRPLIADPKQPQFFVGINSFRSSGLQYTMASVGFGETFGMYGFFGSREGNGLQLSVDGALFAQFNMDTPSHDLINTDYTIGIPATYRYGDNSLRFRIYHQSSHLGDELLLSTDHPERVNLSYEAIEFIYSREWRAWRVYGGGEYLIHKEPGDLKPMSGHWGVEYRGSKPLVWNGRPIGGVDMKSSSRSIAGPSIPASRPASSSVIPTRGSVACASWPNGTRGLIHAASFTTIRLNTLAWGCLWDSDRDMAVLLGPEAPTERIPPVSKNGVET